MRQLGLYLAVLAVCACVAGAREGGPGAGNDAFRHCLSKGGLVENRICMMPVGADGSGCRQYSATSDAGAAAAVIRYRKKGGGFTIFRSEADCG